MLLGPAGEAIPVRESELQLGQWQRVLFLELDRERDRRWTVQVVGVWAGRGMPRPYESLPAKNGRGEPRPTSLGRDVGGGQAAVDHERCPVHERRLVTRKEERCVDDLRGFPSRPVGQCT